MNNNWIAPEPELLPDFIIGGAMKSGTSTLHEILDQHPKVFIPKGEVHFFDIDNIIQHSDFNFYVNNNWIYQSIDKDPKLMWDWYQKKFKKHQNYIKGEDSTTYLASRLAAERISIQKKNIKLIFILRQPSLRAFSNYSHLLRSGRATYSFEKTIQYTPSLVLNRSLYKEQLEAYYKYIPKENIKVILFEELIKKTPSIIKDISAFLGIDYDEFPDDVFKTHSNKGKIPKSLKLQTIKNQLLRNFGNVNYNSYLPHSGPELDKSTPFFVRAINKLHAVINPSTRNTSKINPETKLFLDDYFYDELNGIDELVGLDIMSKWFPHKTI